MKKVARNILKYYRFFQYKLLGRRQYGVLQPGVNVIIEPFRFDINHGDVVHPCVRYVADGYLGYHWWLVYTPYYKGDASMENPVLCYAEGNDPNTPPIEWKYYCLVNEKPADGYNSDPTLFYRDGALYVFWRENYEKSGYPYYRATFAAKVAEKRVERIESPLLISHDDEEDAETCPCFMPTKDGMAMAYGMHLRFHSPLIKRINPQMKKIVNKITLITDLLGGYSQQKHYGLAIWQQDKDDWLGHYCHTKTLKFKNCNALYRPWHMDFFDWEGRRYAIIQTNMSNADLCLAESSDGEDFTFFKRPLITNKSIGKIGIYKPCAGVTPNGIFYLYYTAQDVDNRALNKLYLTETPFGELLSKIR